MQWLTKLLRDLTRLQNSSVWMVRGGVDIPVDTGTPHCHNSELGAVCAVAQGEIRGSSSHCPLMQMLSDVLWNGTQAKPAQTCQMTAWSVSEQDASMSANFSPSGTDPWLPRENMQCSAELQSCLPCPCLTRLIAPPISPTESGHGGTNLFPKCYLKWLCC